MSDFFLGEIRMFGFAWAPQDWALCDGKAMQIQQNNALYALLGITYGGDAKTTFNLPDLRGRTPVCYATAPPPQGLSAYRMGDKNGAESVTLTTSQIAPHSHVQQGVSAQGTTGAMPGNYFSQVAPTGTDTNPIYATPQELLTINPGTVGASAGGAAHNNMQPFAVVNFCISTVGLFPPRQ